MVEKLRKLGQLESHKTALNPIFLFLIMKPFELLVFRNYSNIDEPALSTPLGFLSIRNGIVLGIFGIISFLLYKLLEPTDLIMSAITILPLSLGVSLAMIKPQFGSADSILLSILYMSKTREKKKDIQLKSKKKKRKSNVLGFADCLKKEKISEKDVLIEITISDSDDLRTIRFNLSSPDGTVLSEKLVKCYIDDDLIDTLNTSLDGELALTIQPKTVGKKKLIIRDEADQIINQRTLIINKK